MAETQNETMDQSGTRKDRDSATSRDSDPRATDTGRNDGSTPKPPDGGWGWMVVLSSFMISVFVDGVCFSTGIFFTPFREYYQSSKAETAWVGSVLNGTYLSIGPIVGACVNRYGCRKMTMMGAVIASVAFFLSTFSTSIKSLTFTYGFLGGVGFGFVYLPAIVMVGYYFEKRRALATGIACCGSGIGAFMFAPLCNHLMEVYDWKGATWIISGIVLNGLVFGIFYRPLPLQESAQNKELAVVESGEASNELQSLLKKRDNEDEDGGKEEELLTPVPGGDAEAVSRAEDGSSGFIRYLDQHGNKLFPPRIVTPDICIEVIPPDQNDEKKDMAEAVLCDKSKNDQTAVVESSELDEKKLRSKESGGTKAEGLEKLRESLMKNCKPERPLSDIIYSVTPTIQVTEKPHSKMFQSDLRLKDAVSPLARLAYSQDGFAQLRVRKHGHQNSHHHHHHHHHHLDVNSPLQRKDIFYSGSLRNIPEFQSSGSLEDYRRKVMDVEEVCEEEEERDEVNKGIGRKRKSYFKRFVCDPLLKVFDISLLSSPTFVIYGFSCFLCMLGFFVPFIYLPTLCIDLGMGTSKAAFLISIIGIANTIGRVAAGFISDQPWADCLLINNVALLIGGVATCCVPLFALYSIFAVYTFIFGTCIAVFVSLRSIIMVELMGLQRLTNAFGLVIMCQGISTFIGAPIAGMLSDLTGDYNISFYMAGIFMGLSGIICIPLRRIALWEAARKQKKEDAEEAEIAVNNKLPKNLSGRV